MITPLETFMKQEVLFIAGHIVNTNSMGVNIIKLNIFILEQYKRGPFSN